MLDRWMVLSSPELSFPTTASALTTCITWGGTEGIKNKRKRTNMNSSEKRTTNPTAARWTRVVEEKINKTGVAFGFLASERADRLEARWEVKDEGKDKWRGRDLFGGGGRVTVPIERRHREPGEKEGLQ